jgi:drug/metabolite transporter (DMT)-like permease
VSISTTPRFWGVASGVAAGAMWGTVFLAPKLAPEASPLLLSAGRYLAYGLIAAMLIAPRWKRLVTALDWRAWRALTWLSLTGNIIYFMLLVVSVHFAGVAASALIVGMVPIVVALWGLTDKSSPPFWRVAPPIGVALLAVVLIGWESLSQSHVGAENMRETLIGLACALAALVSWSAFAIGNSRWMGRLNAVSAHDWSLLSGVVTGALALVLAIPAALTSQSLSQDSWIGLMGVSLGIAVVASIIGNAFWNQASRLLPLTMLGQMIVFETLFAFVYGFIWEQRGPSPLEIIAIGLMIASVVWCVRAHRPSAQAVAELEA